MEGEVNKDENKLPPGFRFHPTDEELITCYLVNKISDSNFTGRAIADVDLNKSEPWDLPGKAKMGEKEWYFFSLRDRKYPTGVRTNRATNTGYWKTTGKDKEIYNSVSSELIGMKKTLVFYRGRAPRGEKSNWVMHEYRVHAKSSYRTTKQDEWVVCRVFRKSAAVKKYISNHSTRSAIPTYNLEINPNVVIPPQMMPPEMMQYHHHHHHHPMGMRNTTAMSYADIQELTKVIRSGGGPSNNMTMQMQPQVMNYIAGGGGGGGANCFTISGLNLNLGGGGATSTQPMMLPMPQQHPPQMAQQDVTSSMLSNIGIQNEATNYGIDMSNANTASGNRFMNMDPCPDLDNYWPSY